LTLIAMIKIENLVILNHTKSVLISVKSPSLHSLWTQIDTDCL
jgi:hypothetical protein